jgi:hypothetical protein
MNRMGESRYGSIILDLRTRWRCVLTFTPEGTGPGTQCIGDWVGSRAGLDIAPTGNRTPTPRSSIL